MSDDLANPTDLADSGSVNFDMTGATASVPDEWAFIANPDLWYRLRPAASGILAVHLTAITMDPSPPSPPGGADFFTEFQLQLYRAALGLEFFHGAWSELDHTDNWRIAVRYETRTELPQQFSAPVVGADTYLLRLVDRRRTTSTVTGTFTWATHSQPGSAPGPATGRSDVLLIRRHAPSWIEPPS